jgi:hypothetical protein
MRPAYLVLLLPVVLLGPGNGAWGGYDLTEPDAVGLKATCLAPGSWRLDGQKRDSWGYATFSMKMIDGATLGTYVGYNGDSPAAPAAELSAWVKTSGWTGEGVRLGVSRAPCGVADAEWSDYLAAKPGPWQKLTLKILQPTPALLRLWVQARGKGTLWVDDVQYTKASGK